MTENPTTPTPGGVSPPSPSPGVGLHHPTGVIRLALELLPYMADESLWALATEIELEMVARHRQECLDSRDIASMYSYSGPSYLELQRRRTEYATPARAPREIRDRAATSWVDVEREISERYGRNAA